MAKFRNNHTRSKGAASFMIRGLIIAVILSLFLIWVISKQFSNKDKNPEPVHLTEDNLNEDQSKDKLIQERYYLPKGESSQVIHHNYYALGYNEEYEQANWVAYVLTKESLRKPNVKRERRYMSDPNVSSGSAYYKDYSNSGFTRGHLAPAGDMAFNIKAMKESFFMSNMSPQIRPFNNGIWRELEENTRDWAYKYDSLLVYSGPVFYDNVFGRIGANRVGVPDAFYKVLYSFSNDEAIGYIIPHELSKLPLKEFATTVDEIESVTGLDFLSYLEDTKENELEDSFKLELWKPDPKKFSQRVNKWNNQ